MKIYALSESGGSRTALSPECTPASDVLHDARDMDRLLPV